MPCTSLPASVSEPAAPPSGARRHSARGGAERAVPRAAIASHERATRLERRPADHGFLSRRNGSRHAATWISWPRPEGISFPGRYQECIDNVVEVIRAITRFEPVHLNVPNIDYEDIVRARLAFRKVPMRRIRFHHIRTNECWTRDHGPAFVLRTRRGRTKAAIVDWGYNAWGGKYPPYDADDAVPTRIGRGARRCRCSIRAS